MDDMFNFFAVEIRQLASILLIATLLITIMMMIDDLLRHPAPDAVLINTPTGMQLIYASTARAKSG